MALVILGAPLAIGGVHVESRASLAGLATLAWLWCALTSRGPSRVTSHLAWRAFAALVLVTLVQLIPLPSLWIGSFFEGRLESLHGVDQALGLPAREWIPWTLDASRTSAAVLDLLGWVSVMATLGFVPRERRPTVVVASLVVLSALGVLSVGVVQLLTGAEEILGVYRPEADLSSELFITTFVNPNHAAALLLMASLVSFGLWLDSRETAHSRALLVISACLGLGVLATGSAANGLLLAAGLPVIGLWKSRGLEQGERARVLRALVGAGMLAGTAIMVTDPVSWWETAVQPYLNTRQESALTRLIEVWSVGARVAVDHLGFGVGFGAFPVAAASTMESWSSGFVNFAHNVILEGVSSWGVFIMTLLTLVMIKTLYTASRRAETGVEIAIVVAISATIIQNGVDFSLQIPGVGYCWAALLGSMLVSSGESASSSRGARVRKRGGALALIVTLVTISIGAQAVATDGREMLQVAQKELREGRSTEETRAPLVREHAMNFMALGYGSDLSRALGEEDAGRSLADLAVDLAPTYPPGLIRRARIAIEAEEEEAYDWLERLAATGYGGFRQAMTLVAQRSQDRPEFLLSFVRRSPRFVVGASNALSDQGRSRAGAKLLQWGRKQFPNSEEIATQLIRQLLREPNNAETLALMDASAIQYLANSTALDDPEKSARLKRLGYLAMAHVHGREGRLDEAWHLFEAAARLDAGRSLDARLGQARILLQQERYDSLEELLESLNQETIAAERAQWRVHECWSLLAEARGNMRAAIRSLQRALIFRPRDANLLARLERLSGAKTGEAAVNTGQGR